MVSPLVHADPAALVVAYLSALPHLADEGARVSGVNRPPYPVVAVTDLPGNDRDLTWIIDSTIQLEVLGDLDGTPGKAQLRRIMYVALGLLRMWPRTPWEATDAVVTDVRSLSGAGWSPLGNGQPRYTSTLSITVHPSRFAAVPME